MPTECSAAALEFTGFNGRAVVAAFDGGAITSDAGALLLEGIALKVRSLRLCLATTSMILFASAPHEGGNFSIGVALDGTFVCPP